jgi:hypothetical protein
MSSAESALYTAHEQHLLLHVARDSIAHGLEHRCPLPVNAREYPTPLQEPRATFVTLHADNNLRGCIGTLEARQPLVQDVAHNAYAAAFSDPRFPSLRAHELATLTIHISVLTPPEDMDVRSEADLLRQLRPGIDGLILRDGARRGTFLPAVWESLPDAREFVRHLKRKAGMSENDWPPTVSVQRYRAVVIE